LMMPDGAVKDVHVVNEMRRVRSSLSER
jgi:hypothetical protein